MPNRRGGVRRGGAAAKKNGAAAAGGAGAPSDAKDRLMNVFSVGGLEVCVWCVCVWLD